MDDVQSQSVFPVVGIGGSAGALGAFFALFEALEQREEPSGMAFVIILHLPKDEGSELVELLDARTRLRVRSVDEKVAIEMGTVYVLPPDRTLIAKDGALEPRPRSDEGPPHPVDDLFISLARCYGERTVAIVCSGSGANVSFGNTGVRSAGGPTSAHTPATAEFDEMPRRAMDTGMVDLVQPPEEMVGTLLQVARHLASLPAKADEERQTPRPRAEAEPQSKGEAEPNGKQENAEADPMTRILGAIRDQASIDFRQYKPGTLRRRIERRMHLLHLDDFGRYADVLHERPDEAEALVNDLLITVTSFFRDEAAWETLRERAIEPLLRERSGGDPVRAWTAGCATGEEAYTVAISLFEGAKGSGRPVEIFATDLSHQALSRARNGVYPAASVQHLSEERRRRWFDRRGDTVSVKPELREAVIFAPQNLVQDPPFSRADLVVCRNVLIYLDTEIQRKLIRLFHFALKEGGILFLGSAESIGDAGDLFETIDHSSRIYRRIGATRHDLVDFPVIRPRHPQTRQPSTAVGASPPGSEQRISDQALKGLVDRFAPPDPRRSRAQRLVLSRQYAALPESAVRRGDAQPPHARARQSGAAPAPGHRAGEGVRRDRDGALQGIAGEWPLAPAHRCRSRPRQGEHVDLSHQLRRGDASL